MINDSTPLSLRPATPADRFMIRRWLAEPEIEAWWGSSASAEAEIALAMESPTSLCRMIEYGGRPIGYAHAVDVGIWSEPLPKELPAGCWDMDLFIGSAEHRARGHGGRALELLAEEVFATTLAVACCIFVSVKNERAVRAYERAGFRWVCIWQDRISGPCCGSCSRTGRDRDLPVRGLEAGMQPDDLIVALAICHRRRETWRSRDRVKAR